MWNRDNDHVDVDGIYGLNIAESIIDTWLLIFESAEVVEERLCLSCWSLEWKMKWYYLESNYMEDVPAAIIWEQWSLDMEMNLPICHIWMS